jgi:hypothetical protein
LAGDPVPLAAALGAELARPSGTGTIRQHSPAPSTPPRFRHDEIVAQRCVPDADLHVSRR